MDSLDRNGEGPERVLAHRVSWEITNSNGKLPGSSEAYGTSVPDASLAWLNQADAGLV